MTPPERIYYCPCGDRLWTREQLWATGDEMDIHIADAYLGADSAYCGEEDDVVPRQFWREVANAMRRSAASYRSKPAPGETK